MRHKSVPKRYFKAIKRRGHPNHGGGPVPGSRAVRDIRRYEEPKEFCIAKLSFKRVCQEILHSLHYQMRLQERAVNALQHASEEYLIGVFEDAFLCTEHANRVTMKPRDIQLAIKLRGSKKKFP